VHRAEPLGQFRAKPGGAGIADELDMLSRSDTVGRALDCTIGPVSFAVISPAQVVAETKPYRRVDDARAAPCRAVAASYDSALTCLDGENCLNTLR
jgi:hypothetical protein